MFASYVQAYYDYALSSVYFVDTDTPGFNACFLVKKELKNEKQIKYGCWDAIHVVTCNLKFAPKADYRVISTVMISLEAATEQIGDFNMAGSCAKTREESLSLPADFGTKVDADAFHLATVGRMIETNEDQLRNEVTENYVTKQRMITNSGRQLEEQQYGQQKILMQKEFMDAAREIAEKKD